MSAKDDDSTLTQLATAWVNMYMGGAKVKEAFDIFQELGDKYNWTVCLTTAVNICQSLGARNTLPATTFAVRVPV